MVNKSISARDLKKAKRCLDCPVCRHARKKQKGLAFWFVKALEGNLCPYCRAYEKVYGRKAHESLPRPETMTQP